MRQKINVLIIEDHNLIIEGYIRILENISVNFGQFQFAVKTATNGDSARDLICEYASKGRLDLIVLDISIPASKDKKILSGEDLGLMAREVVPNTKILVITSHSDNFRLNNILNSINPDGLLLKKDITSLDVKQTIRNILKDIPFYSSSILKLLRKRVSTEVNLDKLDRQILHQISIGVKMKNLPNILPLSMGGIEGRKRRLKRVFSVDDDEDATLIKYAKDKGFI